MRVAVVVPALNEAESLPSVLADLPEVHRLVVVDNGSTDGTATVARRHGAEVVFAPRQGYGTAVQAGMNHLRANPPDILVILDADHADPAHRIGDLTGPIVAGVADLVLSDRSETAEVGALTFPQRFGNQLATSLIGAVTGTRFRDLGPFRAVGWDAIERLRMEDPTWGWNVEMQIKAVKYGLRILEIPMPYRARAKGRSKISGSLHGAARAGVKILWAVNHYR